MFPASFDPPCPCLHPIPLISCVSQNAIYLQRSGVEVTAKVTATSSWYRKSWHPWHSCTHKSALALALAWWAKKQQNGPVRIIYMGKNLAAIPSSCVIHFPIHHIFYSLATGRGEAGWLHPNKRERERLQIWLLKWNISDVVWRGVINVVIKGL